jgi:hypothetical protein
MTKTLQYPDLPATCTNSRIGRTRKHDGEILERVEPRNQVTINGDHHHRHHRLLEHKVLLLGPGSGGRLDYGLLLRELILLENLGVVVCRIVYKVS